MFYIQTIHIIMLSGILTRSRSLGEIKCKTFIAAIFTSICLLCIYYLVIFLSNETGNSIPILIWWTPFVTKKERLINCQDHVHCMISSDRQYKGKANADAYLFYGSHFQYYDVPLPRNDSIWAVYHEESPKNFSPLLYKETQSLFNITATFSRHSQFPVTLQYFPSLNNITGSTYFVSTGEKNKLLKELAPVLYIQSNCDTPSQRDIYVMELMEYLKVDSYGLCLHNKQLPLELADVDSGNYYDERIIKLTAKYKFTLAFENAICDDYITEKLWRPLIAGSVPIYLGSHTIKDWLPNKNAAILIQDYENMEELANYINLLNKDDNLYEKHLIHKLSGTIRNTNLIDSVNQRTHDISPILEFECFICKSIYEDNYAKKNQKSIYHCPKPLGNELENHWVTHWNLAKCQSKAFKIFHERNEKFTEEEFANAWTSLYEQDSDCL